MTTIEFYDKNISELASFIETMEPSIGRFGGRRFHVRGDLGPKTLSLNEIITTVENKCRQEQRTKAPLTIINAIKKLDQEGNDLLLRANIFKRILTYVRQFFGNLRFNKQMHIQALVPNLLDNHDVQFLFDDFNRNPNLQDAARILIERLVGLARTAGFNHWTENQITSLGGKLWNDALGKIHAIRSLPDNDDTIPLKRDFQRRQDAFNAAAVREERIHQGPVFAMQRDFRAAIEYHQRLIQQQNEEREHLHPLHAWNRDLLSGELVNILTEADILEVWISLFHSIPEHRLDNLVPQVLDCFLFYRDPIWIAKLIHKCRQGGTERDTILYNKLIGYVKERRPQIYGILLKNLFLLETVPYYCRDLAQMVNTIQRETRMTNLTTNDFNELMGSIRHFVRLQTENLATLPAESIEVERVIEVMRRLFVKHWDLLPMDRSIPEASENREKMIAIDFTLNEILRTIRGRPGMIARFYSNALKDIGVSESIYILGGREDREVHMEESFNQFKRQMNGIFDLGLDHLPQEFKDELNRLVLNEGQGYFSFRFALEGSQELLPSPVPFMARGGRTIEALEELLALLPPDIFGCVVKHCFSNNLDAVLTALHADRILVEDRFHIRWSPQFKTGQLNAYDKLISLYQVLGEDERRRLFPNHTVEEDPFSTQLSFTPR